MKEITKYISDDGKEFDDEDKCLDYERGIKIKKVYGFKAYNRQGEEIFPKDYISSDMDDFVYDACYIRITNIQGWEEFEEFCNDEFGTYFYDGLDEISETGLYFKDDDHDCWTNWDYEYEKLRAIRKKMDY